MFCPELSLRTVVAVSRRVLTPQHTATPFSVLIPLAGLGRQGT